MIRAEDRDKVIEVAMEIFCARVVANSAKHGYSPDMNLCVGEAAALVNKVNLHLPPHERPEPLVKRGRKSGAAIHAEITLNRNGN